ncbi:MAG: dephospho-CoA kinase [Pseudomonadota bacterium]
MIKLGLTGSIGMGKSTTADFFRQMGIPVHDADATVHDLYRKEAVPLIEDAFPGTTKNGEVDRTLLSQRVLGMPEEMKRLEAIVHPLVWKREQLFLQKSEEAGAAVVVLDIPLLFEVGAFDRVDKVLVVTAPADVQRQRVLARKGMTEERLSAILAKQMPDEEKRKRADYIIDTSLGLDHARDQVEHIVQSLQPRTVD